jgi:Mn-dependent DtxR family transcriptional regulator
MARERDSYRDILEDIYRRCGDKALLSLAEVARYLGIDRRTVTKRFGIGTAGITAPALARMLARL